MPDPAGSRSGMIRAHFGVFVEHRRSSNDCHAGGNTAATRTNTAATRQQHGQTRQLHGSNTESTRNQHGINTAPTRMTKDHPGQSIARHSDGQTRQRHGQPRMNTDQHGIYMDPPGLTRTHTDNQGRATAVPGPYKAATRTTPDVAISPDRHGRTRQF